MTATESGHLALVIADRLIDPDAVTAGLSSTAASSLSGLAGTALLHARLATVDDRFAIAAIEHWNLAAAHTRRHGATGTFTGPGALASSLILGAPHLPDPQQVHSQCVSAARWLSTHAVALVDRHHERIRSGLPPTSWAVYDTIGGLAGLGRVLIAAIEQGHQHASAGLDRALTILTAMTLNQTAGRPGWWLPADAHPATTHVGPTGAAATGVAHGIAGPLALLAIARIAGHDIPGQDTAIRAAADWLLRWHDPATDTWPTHVTGYELDHDVAAPVRGRRDAWCYGTPGISTALTHAADALGDDTYRAAAYHTMRTLAERGPRTWDVEGPTLCHGHAGILQASRDHPDLARLAADHIIAASDITQPHVIRHVERGTAYDHPGLLAGAAGVALALADHANLSTPKPVTRWDSILLLS